MTVICGRNSNCEQYVLLHHGGLFDESRDRSAARPKDVESETPVLISPYCRTESTGHRTIARLENPYDLAMAQPIAGHVFRQWFKVECHIV